MRQVDPWVRYMKVLHILPTIDQFPYRTWHGEPGEQWSSAQCLESVLISIQSLMSSNPYQNEPGFEKTKFDDAEALSYAAKVRGKSSQNSEPVIDTVLDPP